MTSSSSDRTTICKTLIAPLRAAMRDFCESKVRGAMHDLIAPDATVHLCEPFGDTVGPDGFFDAAYAALFRAIPDLERRDYIVMGGPTAEGAEWIGCGGYYTGRFLRPWMDIPPTGHVFNMRFHEFYRFEGEQVAEVQLLWDIPEVMIQAGSWPMAPSLGREWHVPGPATHDGVILGPYDAAEGQRSCRLVTEMLEHMIRHPAMGGPEAMEMPRFWSERMSWYGPAGIGTARGIKAFRDWHQIPFLRAMPDRGQYPEQTSHHFFGDRSYVAVTGWPDMMQTISYGGWLGIAPTGKTITLRSLDFWRLEDGKIRENWVLVDLLDVYKQLAIDVFLRLREFNKRRNGFDSQTGAAIDSAWPL